MSKPSPITSVNRSPQAALQNYQPLVAVLIAVCVGIIADRMAWWGVPRSFLLWWCIGAAALAGWLALSKLNRTNAAEITLLIGIVAAAGSWHHYCWNLFGEDELGRAAAELPQPVCIKAIARGAPQEVPAPAFDPLRSAPTGARSRLIVDVTAARDGDQWRSASGCARVIVDHPLKGVHAGDRLRVFGELEAPFPAANPGEFDPALFDRSERELSIVRVKIPQCIVVLERGSIWNSALIFSR